MDNAAESEVSLHYTLVIGYVSLPATAYANEPQNRELCEKYASVFFLADGLQALTHCFRTLIDHAHPLMFKYSNERFRYYYDKCVYAVRMMWDFLTLNAQRGDPSAKTPHYTNSDAELKHIAKRLVD
jgi:hypothetical protein